MRWQSVFLWFSWVLTIVLVVSCPGTALPRPKVLDIVKVEGLSNNVEINNVEDLRSINDHEKNLEDDTQKSAGAGVGNTSGVQLSNSEKGYVREPRAAAYNLNKGQNQVKHFDHIPQGKSMRVMHGTSPPPEESDEDDFETLEANREAFLEILNEHAKHPHRRRSLKRHSNRFLLKYDFDTKRYSLTEQQSEEF